MKIGQRILALATATTLLASAAHAQVATFDDLPAAPGCGSAFVPNGYNGLNWNNFGYLIGSQCGPNNGYINGTTSGTYVGFNAFGGTASFGSATPFTWSAYLTAAWYNNLDVTIVGTLNGNPVYNTTFQLNTSGPTLFTFNQAVDNVSVSAANGVDAGLGGCCTHVAFDDVAVNTNVVPEPGTILLVSAGLGLVGIAARRRRA